MPLSVSEKEFVLALFEDSYWAFMNQMEIKIIFVRTYLLLQNQKNQVIREAIATHAANKIVNFWKYYRSQDFTGLFEFFRESILSAKIDRTFLQNIFLHSSLSTKTAIFYYEHLYERKCNKQLAEIFKKDKQGLKQATLNFQNTGNLLKKWIKEQPTEYFNKKTEVSSQKFFFKTGIGIDLFLTAIFVITFLNIYEDENNLPTAIVLAFLATFLALPVSIYAVSRVPVLTNQIDYYKLLYRNVNFSINTLEAYENANTAVVPSSSARRTPVVYQPYIVIDIREAPESAYLEEATSPAPAKIKIKTRGTAGADYKDENVSLTANLTIPTYTAAFFAERFADANAYYIVALNGNRKTPYFAIWDVQSILAGLKNEIDHQSYGALLDVFKKGTIAGKTGQSGVKYLCNFGIFELKKKSIAARIYGYDEITKEGRKALIFSEFSRKGLH